MAVLNAKTFREGGGEKHALVDCPSRGGELRIKKLSLARSLNAHDKWKAIRKDKDGNPQRQLDVLEFYVWLLSISIVDEADDFYLNSDAGREEIGLTPPTELLAVGNEAMILNGYAQRDGGDAKKKELERGGTSRKRSTDSSSASVSPPADST